MPKCVTSNIILHTWPRLFLLPRSRTRRLSRSMDSGTLPAPLGVSVMNGRIELEDKVYFPHSLGIFYQALTQYLGFPNYGDEYKVMGLAPYGRPLQMEAMRQIVQLKRMARFAQFAFFRHHKEKYRIRMGEW